MTRHLSLAALAATLLICLGPRAVAQEPRKTASISGVVTADGRPVAGAPVWVSGGSSSGSDRSVETDAEGRYRIDGLPPGRYVISSFKAGYFPPLEGIDSLVGAAGRTVTLDEGESVESFDVPLTRGGVITGRVVDARGRPLAEVSVGIETRDEDGSLESVALYLADELSTDDRGVYRAYGLPPGRYFVSAAGSGDEEEIVPKTYFPATREQDEAKAVEILGTEEVSDVDVVVATARPRPRFSVAGRVVDADTGEPVPGVELSLTDADSMDAMSYGDTSGAETDEAGEFRLRSVAAGRYRVDARRPCGDDCSYPAGSIWIDVAAEVRGLVLPSPRGLTLAGHVVLEGVTDPAVASRISALTVRLANLDAASTRAFVDAPHVPVAPDGSFRVPGLSPGRFSVFVSGRGEAAGFHLIRAEGIHTVGDDVVVLDQPHDVSDVRLVVRYGTGSIRGRVRFVNGTLPPKTRIGVLVSCEAPRIYKFPDVDGSEFVVSGLLPGTYEVIAGAARGRSARASVTVAESGPPAEITLTIDLSAPPPPDEEDPDDEEDDQ